jgi:glutathione S-transferase
MPVSPAWRCWNLALKGALPLRKPRYVTLNPACCRITLLGVLADGTTVTETTPILMVLDSLAAPDKRLLGDGADGWKRLAAYGRVLGMLDGIAVWNRELRRPVHERSPGVIALEETRAARIAAALQDDVARGVYAMPDAGFLALIAVLGYCERRHRVWAWRDALPGLATWFDRASDRASFAATMPPVSGI